MICYYAHSTKGAGEDKQRMRDANVKVHII